MDLIDFNIVFDPTCSNIFTGISVSVQKTVSQVALLR